MDKNFTQKIQSYLNTPLETRDVSQGALLLLRLTGNQIMYRNVILNPAKHAAFVDYELRKHYNLRVADITHKEVVAMQAQADTIIAEHCSFVDDNPAKDFKKGKRQDHDVLPAEIQKLYVDNLDILRRMRDIQTKLRIMSEDPNICPDSDRYPYLKEIIRLDKTLHDNWNTYDHFVIESGTVEIQTSVAEEEAKTAKRINLLAGKFAKKPTEEIKKIIVELYSTLTNPTTKLTKKLLAIGIIE